MFHELKPSNAHNERTGIGCCRCKTLKDSLVYIGDARDKPNEDLAKKDKVNLSFWMEMKQSHYYIADIVGSTVFRHSHRHNLSPNFTPEGLISLA